MPKWGAVWPSARSGFFSPRRNYSTLDGAMSLGFNETGPTSTVWPVGQANVAIYWPVTIESNIAITSFYLGNGAAVLGNIDLGLYTSDGTKIVSTGSTAQAGTNVIQEIAAAAVVGPGNYYMGITLSDGTGVATVLGLTLTNAAFGRTIGLLGQGTALPLPATATFAASAVTVVPVAGFTANVFGGNVVRTAVGVIHSHHALSVAGSLLSNAKPVNVDGSGAWPAANRAIYVPFTLGALTTFAEAFMFAGTTSSGANAFDIGVYTNSGVRIFSTGSTTQSGSTSTLNVVDITDTQFGPGSYYMALALNSTDHTFRANSGVAATGAMGVMQQATAFALPATATMVVPTSGYVPLFGFTTQAVI